MITIGDAILAINPDAVFNYEDINKINWGNIAQIDWHYFCLYILWQYGNVMLLSKIRVDFPQPN